MGYETYYSIDVHCDDEKVLDEIVKYMEEKEIIPYVFDRDLQALNSSRWYSEEEDMRAVSATFPEILFYLHGEGDDSEDMWDAYFLGGKAQYCPATITYDVFDPEKLT